MNLTAMSSSEDPGISTPIVSRLFYIFSEVMTESPTF